MSDELQRYMVPSGTGVAPHPAGLLYRRKDVDPIIDRQAARIRELEADVKAVLRREHDANKKAFEHLRRAEKAEIVSKNYAAFNREWRKRAEAAEELSKCVAVLEAKLAKAVEALEWCARVHDSSRARTTLAALKGQDDE